MRRCIVTGRILPERANVQFGPIKCKVKFGDVNAELTTHVDYSLVSALLHFETDISNIYDINNIVRSVIGTISDYIAFTIQAAYSITLDQIIDIETGSKYSIPASEPIFNEQQQNYLFQPRREDEEVFINLSLFGDNFTARLLNEATNALRRPELSAMYCRLAIETIRAYFQEDQGDEALAWSKLRSSLNVDRSTLDSFWKIAAEQRHGKTIPLSWNQRKEMLQTTWEITSRYLVFREAALSESAPPTFPKL